MKFYVQSCRSDDECPYDQCGLYLMPCLAGIRIFCTEERSQGKNRERAMSLLRSKLFDLEQEKQRSEIQAQRKSQVSHSMKLPNLPDCTSVVQAALCT